MRYYLKEKLVSVGDDYLILDENQQVCYIADGYGFSFGKRFSFQNEHKEEIFDVKQKLFTYRKTFIINKNKRPIAKVFKAVGSLRDVFYFVNLETKEKVKIVGKLLEHEYKFINKGRTFAEVSKKWFRASDTYGIDITSDQIDIGMILSTAVIIDLVCHEKDSKYNRG